MKTSTNNTKRFWKNITDSWEGNMVFVGQDHNCVGISKSS